MLAFAGALVLTFAACASEGETGLGASETPGPPSPSSTDTPFTPVEAEIPVGGEPIGIASGEGSLWVVNSAWSCV